MRYLLCLLWLSAVCAHAEIVADHAWARATMPGQSVGGVFLTLSSDQPATVVGAKCDCAGRVEIHRTVEENGIARMRQQKTVILTPSKPVEFKPGGLHVMLLGLKAPLKAGDQHQLRVSVLQGMKRSEVLVPFTVRAVTDEAADGHDHHHHH